MSFPFSHIPANLTKLAFTGSYAYVPVNLGVDDAAPEPEVCWDRWQDQPSHRLKIQFTDEWEDQAADGISIRWLCPLELCEGLWEDTRGNRVDFDFKLGHEWLTVPGNSVDLDFSCEVAPDECNTLWKDYQGNIVPIAFNKPWATYQGNQVPITFACEGGGETPDYTYFTGYIDAHDGSEFDLTFEITWIVNSIAGETLSVNITDSPMQDLGISFSDGQTLNTVLATDMVFTFANYTGESVAPIYLGSDVQFDNVEFRDGQFSSIVLTDNPPWQIVTNAYDGSSVTAALSTSYVFDFNSYDGSVLSLTLSDTPFWYFYSGESAQLSLETYPSQNFGLIPNFTGETFAAELATTHSIALNFFTGESTSGYLSTDTNLELVEFRGGEYTSFALTENLPWQIFSNAYDGASVTFELSTVDTMRVFAYEGQSVSFELDLRPAPEMLVTAHDGQVAQLSLSIPQNLGDLRFFDGPALSVTSMDNDQFWRMFAGESVLLQMATDTTLPAFGYAGETFDLDLNIRPSEGIGIVRAYEGQRIDLTVNVLTAVLLYPNEISARQEFVCEFDITTSFDLLDTSCCPIKEDPTRIELNDHVLPDVHYEGDKTVVQFDLSTLPRFKIDMVEGSEFKTIDPNFLGEFNFYEGHVPSINYIDFEFVDFRLCYGNFIPDGDSTFIELVSTYDDQCVADYMYAGESTHVLLENNVQFDLPMHASEHMFIDVFIDPIIRVEMRAGEFMRITNPEFSVHMHDGPSVTLTFDEPRWMIYAGESMVIGNLTTDYDVEFLERGCLDNEFVPTNENGDPDWDNFNPVPIELEEYRHSILARCF